MPVFPSALFVSLASAVVITSALAQSNSGSSNFTSFAAGPGKPVQLGYYASAKKDCTPAPLPTIRVVEAPKSGIMTVRKAVLQTDSVKDCPGLKTPAQVVFYLARPGDKRTDHLIYEVTAANGQSSTYDVSIDISASESIKTNSPHDKI